MALLRASGEYTGDDYDLSAVLGDSGKDTGIPHADVLIRFAETAIAYDDDATAAAREAAIGQMGEAALVDAAAIAANFDAIDRVADAIGIPLEEEKAAISADFREELGIDNFGRAGLTAAAE